MKQLVILTLEYPFGIGESFLTNELDFYSKRKVRVILVPFKTAGTARPLPPGVSLSPSKTKDIPWAMILLQTIKYSWFWKEVMHFFKYLFFSSSRASFLFFLKVSIGQRENLLHLKSKNTINPVDTVLYSYWLGALTGGAILFNRCVDNAFKIVSRAHGGDLYEYRYAPPYIPFREFVLKNVDRVATVSQDGALYLRTKYSSYKTKITCHSLGTNDPGFVCKPSQDGVFRIVSCAHVSPVKRLHLIAEGLQCFKTQHPEIRVHWTHLGGGRQLEQLITASASLIKTVTCSFLGDQTPSEVIEFYRQNAIDLFVNTSKSEGMPFSIMEAMSVGVPILATNVGGVKEMIDESCGKLLPRDLSPQQLAGEIFNWIMSKDEQQRKNSIRKWKALFDAEKNYLAFYDEMLN